MKKRNWFLAICFSLPVLLLVGVLISAPPDRVAAALQPQVTVEPAPRYGHTMVTISDTVYLFGGTNITPTQGTLSVPLRPAGDLLHDLWCYKNQEWTKPEPSGTAPSPRYSHAATALAGLMYVYGGTNGTNVFNDMWEYDPIANTWTEKPWTGPYNAPQVYENTLTAGDDGYLYLYGGRRPGGYISTASYRYNPNTGEASSFSYAPDARAGAIAVNLKGKIYLFGGIGGEPPTYQNDIWVLDTQVVYPVWTKLEPRGDPYYGFPPPRANATMTAYGDVIVLFNGNNDEKEFDDMWIFYPSEGRWQYAPYQDPLLPRTRSAAGTLGSGTSRYVRTAQASSQAILIFGGLRDGAPIAETLVFQLLWHLHLPLITR